MLGTLGLALLALVSTVGPSQASGFTEMQNKIWSHLAKFLVQEASGSVLLGTITENGLSLLSFQLCNYSVTRNVQKVEAVHRSHVTYAPCGGWIPWRRCPKTVYRTRYLAVDVPQPRNVTDCCRGYEQLGLYCVPPLNRSRETPERDPVTFWYDVTVLVKMAFKELEEVDPRLLNHMRLLYSMVTSALQPLHPSVHHLQSASGDPSTTVSQLLLGLPWPVPVANVSATLHSIVQRVYEVIDIRVQDCPPIRDYMTLNVTSSSFRVSWRLHSPWPRTFHVQVYKGEELLRSARTAGRSLEVAGLEAGELYGVRTGYQGCGANVTATLAVRTDARVFQVTVRVLNRNVTGALLNRSSTEFRDFSRQLLHEAGSVVATLRLTVQDPEFPVGVSTLAPMLPPLLASTVFQIDPRGTLVQDWDECADSRGHDCSPAAQCINVEGSYTCRCRTAKDANPSRAGRAYHTVWHASLPTGDTAPAALDPTRPQNSVPGPSGSPDLPAAPTPESLKLPACVPVPIERVTVSDVTSTSFHVAWAADLTPHPTFQLTLTSPRSTAVRLETRDASLTLSGLEPGVLYLVDIAAKACGNGSARARLKVRTVAQKLRGKVRIANVRYVEPFRNASSREYQDFLELFFRVVRDSLPAAMLRHVDAGGVQMEVTRVANGSVVVEFNLLIIADVDVHEVSAAFLVALRNGSLLEVVVEDTFIQDYDECDSQEHDCEPGASCHNTLGSYTCSCPGGAPRLPVEFSGRSCDGDSPGNTTQAPGPPLAAGPEQAPTPTGTVAAMAPGAGPGPQGLPPRLNLTEAVRVLCDIEKVAIAVQRRFLQQESIPESSLYLGHPSCNVSDHNSTHVLLVAGWSECGTVVQSNVTNTVVRTTLRNDLSPEGIIHHLKILSPIHCAFQNDLLTSSGYTPEWGVYTIIEDLHGAGSFVTEMRLFIGDSPIPRNYSVSASDDVKIEVGLYKQKSNLKVVLTECWATPSSNARDPVMFGFINNSCPIPNTHTNVIKNGDSSKAQFKLKIFSFINNSIVYLHCRLRICMDSPGSTCKINCNDVKSPRSSEASTIHQTSWGPLVRSEGERPGAEPGLGAGYLVLIVVAVFAVVAGAAALVLAYYQRMTGKYSFRAGPDDFGYQVFSGWL
ncbi:uromodulin-like 1 [Prionailurus iriomotensis]